MLKKLFTYSFSVWLSICVLLASSGVPVFAHSCNMNSDCKQISVLPSQSCCSENEPEEKSADGCIEAESCCIDELTIIKADLPAVKSFSTKISILPQIYFATLPTGTVPQFAVADIHFKLPPQNAPPLPGGRNLLACVQTFRI